MWAILSITNRCNLSCQHCIRGSSSHEDMELDFLPRLFDELRTVKCKGLSLTGGEPVAHPQFAELLREIKRANWRINIVSNGIRCQEYLDLLKDYKHRFLHMVLSLDSHKEELNDELRGKGSYAGVLDAVKQLRAYGQYTKLSHVINNRNYKDLGDFCKFAIEDQRIPRVHLTTTIETPWNKHLVLTPKQREELHADIVQQRIRYENKVITMASVGFQRPLTFCDNIAAIRDVTIDYDGNLVFCCDEPGRGTIIGNLKDRSLLDLLGDYVELQNKIKKARFVEVGKGNWDGSNDCDFCIRVLGEGLNGR